MVRTSHLTIETQGGNELHDLTDRVHSAINDSNLQNGIVTVFVAHTTAAVTISEMEAGLIEDIHLPMERLAPAGTPYRHNALNADDNAHSHLLSSVIGPSLTIPFSDGRLTLGTWQRVVLIELDPHPRHRNVVLQMLGE